MKKHLIPAFMLLSAWLWAGMVIGISFIEAPVKFTAPHVTLAIGLGIGRLVFGVMNKVEIAFCAVMLSGLFFQKMPKNIWVSVGIITAALGIQTGWLLPALDVRALSVIAGVTPPPSNLHFVYVGLEFLKFGLLLITGFQILKVISKPIPNIKIQKQNSYKKPVTA